MNLLFIPALLEGDYRTFFIKLSLVIGMWVLVVIAASVDLRTGIKASKRLGCFKTTSKGLRQSLKKVSEYFTYLTIALLFDVVLSYLTTITDICSVFGLFKIPLFTIIVMAIILIIEFISVKENNEKGQKAVLTPELVNKALELIAALGPDKMKAVAEILKIKEKEK